MNKPIPSFLLEKKNIIKLLIFTAFFSLVFINIYRPFGSESWKEMSRTEFFLFSAIIVAGGIVILAVSRFMMYKTRVKFPLGYWQFFIWIFIEIAVISIGYSFLMRLGFNVKQDFIVLFGYAFLYTALVLFFPYTASWLYFALRDTERELERVTHEENFVDLEDEQNKLINFQDEKGTLRFSVKLSNLLFIESADNYVEIHYLQKGKLSRFLLRNTLKAIEEKYSSNILLRCHRSFMINIKKVKVLRKDKDGIFLEMDIEGMPDIPVSKTYSEQVIQLFSKHSI